MRARKLPFLRYGTPWKWDTDPLTVELYAISQLGHWTFKDRKCGEGLPFHVKQAMKLLWPEDMYWHRWTDLILETFLKCPGRTACFGPSSSQKSFTFSRIGLVLFYARPKGTTGLISSTTLDALKRRIWDYIVRSDKSARAIYPWLPGSLIESKLMLLADPKDEEGRSFKDGIVGVACRKSGGWTGLQEYVGTKNEVVFLIADEANFMVEGFLESLANLESNPMCYSAILGNLSDVFCPLGRAAEPKLGWDSLSDTDKSRVYDTKWQRGRAIQLIGMDSPNLDFPAGQEPYAGLIGRDYIEKMAQNYGADSDKFNMFASGKIPRSSMNRTVFTKAMCLKHGAMESVTWGHTKVVRGYCLDAAYSGIGGDRTPGAPFIFGLDNTNRWRFWLGPIRIYPGSDSPKMSHAEAIVLMCREECQAHDIPPDHVFYDSTGRGELASAFARLWSAEVQGIEFGGPATERPSFTGERFMDGDHKGDVKPCREVFDRFVTELWFAIRHCILADQMRGLPESLIDENCQRRWELVKGAKYRVEPKLGVEDGKPVGMKARGLPSPDLGDMLAVGLEGARRLGFPLGKHTTPEKKHGGNRWLQNMKEVMRERAEKEVLTVP